MSRPRFIPAVLAAGLFIGFGALAPQAHADDGPLLHAVLAADAPSFAAGGVARFTLTFTNVGTVDLPHVTWLHFVIDPDDCTLTSADGTSSPFEAIGASGLPIGADIPVGATVVCHMSDFPGTTVGVTMTESISFIYASNSELIPTDATSVLDTSYLVTPAHPSFRVDASVDDTKSPVLTYSIVVANTGDASLDVFLPINQFTGSGTPTFDRLGSSASAGRIGHWAACSRVSDTMQPYHGDPDQLMAAVDPGLSATCTISYIIPRADLGKTVNLTVAPTAVMRYDEEPVAVASDSDLTATYTVPADADIPEVLLVHASVAPSNYWFVSGGTATWTLTVANVGTGDIPQLLVGNVDPSDCVVTLADGTTRQVDYHKAPGIDLPIGSTAVCHWSTIVAEPAGTAGWWLVDGFTTFDGRPVATDDTSLLQASYMTGTSSPSYRVDTSVDATKSPTLTYNVVVTNTGDVGLSVDLPVTQFAGSGKPTITSVLDWFAPASCGTMDGTSLYQGNDANFTLRAVVNPGLSVTCTVSYAMTKEDRGKTVGLTVLPVAQTFAHQPVTAAADSVLDVNYTVPTGPDIPTGGTSASTQPGESLAAAVLLLTAGVAVLRVRRHWLTAPEG